MQCPRYVDDIHQTSFARHVMKRAQLNYVATLPHCGKKLHMDHLHSYVKTMETLIWNFGRFQDSNASKKIKGSWKNFHANSDSANARYWSAPAAFGSYLSVHLSILKLKGTEPILLQSRRIQWWNIFKSSLPPRRKWTKYRKYHTPYGCGTHPHSRDRIAKSAAAVLRVVLPPQSRLGSTTKLWLSLATK